MDGPGAIGIMAVTGALLAGILLGWLLRAGRTAREKKALSGGWQHQLEAQQKENDRVARQNTSLMERVSQCEAANKDARNRAAALAEELKEALARQNDLERQHRELQSGLDRVTLERNRLRKAAAEGTELRDAAARRLREHESKIARLKVELARWQERVPPLVERYRERDEEARSLEAQLEALRRRADEGARPSQDEPDERALAAEIEAARDDAEQRTQEALTQKATTEFEEKTRSLEAELEAARARISELESRAGDGTRIESMERGAINGLDASNDQYEDTVETEAASADGQDDLKRIKGIGPAIEKTLHRHGIRHLRQIASLGEDEVERLAAELRGIRARIDREDWIGQARRLLGETGGN